MGSSPLNPISYDPKMRAGSLAVGLAVGTFEITDWAVECTVTWLELENYLKYYANLGCRGSDALGSIQGIFGNGMGSYE